MKKMALFLSISIWFLMGCNAMLSQDPYTNETQVNNTTTGASVGAVTGAIAGALLGHDAKGALIGGAVGALAGAGVGHLMDNQESQLRQVLRGTGVQIAREGDNIRLIMPSNITFATNNANINNNFYPALNSVAIVLKRYNETRVDISGHTDSTGSYARNVGLSQSRADSVMSYLNSQGISAGRMQAKGYADSRPIASNNTANGRAENRRVEILLGAL